MKKFRKIPAVVLALLLMALCAFPTFADTEKDYRIYDAWWQEEADGGLTARWEKPDASTAYHVHLYRGNNKKEVGAWIACSSNVKNFTKTIADNGTGTYYFAVYPDKIGTSAVKWSDALEVDSTMIRNARNALNNSPAEPKVQKHTVRLDAVLSGLGLSAFNETGSDRWLKLNDGRWVYQKADSSLYKNCWVQTNGKWYLLDAQGIMQANGWKKVDRKWYYLGPDGAMWTNTVTPDGYQVNGKGEWTVNGAVVIDNGTPTVPVTQQKNTNTSSQKKQTGTKPAEEKTYLEQPAGFYMTEGYQLHWSKVAHASRYLVQVRTNDLGSEKLWTDRPTCELDLYESMHAWVTITACGPEGSKKVVNSSAYTIEDLDVFHEENTIKGTLTIQNGKPYYENEFGEKGGWQQILGSWYHFKKNGYADGPGWFKDTDENWYYFNNEYKMVTGWITDNGVQYFLNDGTNRSFPVGAWVH